MNRASTTAPDDPRGVPPRPHWQVWAIALSAGLAAGIGSWLAGELAHGAFKPRLFAIEVMGGLSSRQPSRESQNAADSKNATVVFAILGGVTGLTMGFAGGLAGRSGSRGLKVGVGALVIGGLVGALASLALVPLFFRGFVPDRSDLLAPVMIHGSIWVAVGAVGGLAFAIGMRCWGRLADAIAGACFGALLATIFFHASAAGLFPDSGSTEPVASTSIVRLLAMGLISVLVAIGAAAGAQGGFLHPASSGTEN